MPKAGKPQAHSLPGSGGQDLPLSWVSSEVACKALFRCPAIPPSSTRKRSRTRSGHRPLPLLTGTGKHVDQRGLGGAGKSQNAKEFAFSHIQRDAIEDIGPLYADAKALRCLADLDLALSDRSTRASTALTGSCPAYPMMPSNLLNRDVQNQCRDCRARRQDAEHRAAHLCRQGHHIENSVPGAPGVTAAPDARDMCHASV